MTEKRWAHAWASTALAAPLAAPRQEATVLASLTHATYVHLPAPGAGPQVLALLSTEAVRLPIGMVVGHGPLPPEGATVVVGEGLIRSEACTWCPTRWWDPRPRLSAAGLVANRRRLTELLLDSEPVASCGIPLAEALATAGALAKGDGAPALARIGLGPGLTPAADDVIAGALAVLSLVDQLPADLASAVLSHAAGRTPALSAALLGAASRGQVIPEARDVLSVVAGDGPPCALRDAAAALSAVGATSGRALLAGLAGALAALVTPCSQHAGSPAHSRRSPR